MIRSPLHQLSQFDPKALIPQYQDYLKIRASFLLNRIELHQDFPGIHTGYDSITGQEFGAEDILSYSWINGRGVCVLVRFAEFVPELKAKLMHHANRLLSVMQEQYHENNGHFPFVVSPDGSEADLGCTCPADSKSYSDLFACFGFLQYASATADKKRLALARKVFKDTLAAINQGRFVTEPSPTPPDRVMENPWSIALNLANEFTEQLNDQSYLDIGSDLLTKLLNFYVDDIGAFLEFLTPDGEPFTDEKGRYIVDPGHAIEFAGFALEYCRLCKHAGTHERLVNTALAILPRIILWNIEKGWNHKFGGIYKMIDAATADPIDDTMPWWIMPETMLACILAYLQTRDERHLDNFTRVHNTYVSNYINEKVGCGPYQNIDGTTGKPIRIVPACKFQDPEFHSGKNILRVLQMLREHC